MGHVDIILKPSSLNEIFTFMQLNQLYKVCFCANKAIVPVMETGFIETGLAAAFQDILVSWQINLQGSYIMSSTVGNNRGVRATLPICNGIVVQMGRSGIFSLVAADGDCIDTSPGGHNMMFSPDNQILHLEIFGLPIQSLDGIVGIGGFKTSGIYQGCFKSQTPGAKFVATGLLITLQNRFVSLIVNKAALNQGLRTAVPQTNGNCMQ